MVWNIIFRCRKFFSAACTKEKYFKFSDCPNIFKYCELFTSNADLYIHITIDIRRMIPATNSLFLFFNWRDDGVAILLTPGAASCDPHTEDGVTGEIGEPAGRALCRSPVTDRQRLSVATFGTRWSGQALSLERAGVDGGMPWPRLTPCHSRGQRPERLRKYLRPRSATWRSVDVWSATNFGNEGWEEGLEFEACVSTIPPHFFFPSRTKCGFIRLPMVKGG